MDTISKLFDSYPQTSQPTIGAQSRSVLQQNKWLNKNILEEFNAYTIKRQILNAFDYIYNYFEL